MRGPTPLTHRPFAPKTKGSFELIAEQCYANALDAITADDAERAARWFGVLAVVLPRDERAWLGLGCSAERSGNVRAAASFFELGAALDAGSVRCRVRLGRALRALGDDDAAERAFDAAEALVVDRAAALELQAERRAS